MTPRLSRDLNEIVPLSQLVFVIGKFYMIQSFFFLFKLTHNLCLAESGAGKSTLVNSFISHLKPGKHFNASFAAKRHGHLHHYYCFRIFAFYSNKG